MSGMLTEKVICTGNPVQISRGETSILGGKANREVLFRDAGERRTSRFWGGKGKIDFEKSTRKTAPFPRKGEGGGGEFKITWGSRVLKTVCRNGGDNPKRKRVH